jgi:ketosteroid isomerase-like protein
MNGTDDELAIRNRYASYCFAADDRDPIAMADCFTPDAVVEVGQSRLEGRDAIARVQETPSTKRHFVLNLWILAIEDGRADVRAYFLVLDKSGSIAGFGRYDDGLVREADGGWRWRHRSIAYDWQSAEYNAFVRTVLDNASRD